jgi:hypothetical protein
MTDDETQLAVIVAALRRRSARSLLQRRVTDAINQIEALLTTGWSIPELAEHLAAAGVSQRNGCRLSAGHFGVLVTRARAKARAASGQNSQPRTLHPAKRSTSPDIPMDGSAPAITQIAQNLGKLAEKAERGAQDEERQAATEQQIAARLDTMFGRDHLDLDSSRSPTDLTASSSSKVKRGRRRQSP